MSLENTNSDEKWELRLTSIEVKKLTDEVMQLRKDIEKKDAKIEILLEIINSRTSY